MKNVRPVWITDRGVKGFLVVFFSPLPALWTLPLKNYIILFEKAVFRIAFNLLLSQTLKRKHTGLHTDGPQGEVTEYI